MVLKFWTSVQIVFVLVIALQLIVVVSAGTSTPKRKALSGGSARKGFRRSAPVTSLERPPVVTASEKKSGRYDEAGVTLPPVVSKSSSKAKALLKNLDFGESLMRFRSAFSRLSNAFTSNSSNGVSEGRYMEGWMEGAMVPMTFLLMAAFIMDILQRLFPLPYATFVAQQAYNRASLAEEAAKPVDLTKVQLNTPLGSFGIETNENNGFNLFGRSNQGNPEIVPASAYSNANDNHNDQMIDYYLNSILAVNQSQPVVSDASSYGIPIISDGWGHNEYSPGSGYLPGVTDLGSKYNDGVTTNNNGGHEYEYEQTNTGYNQGQPGGYGNGGDTTPSGGYGSSQASGTIASEPFSGASEPSIEPYAGSQFYNEGVPSTLESSVNAINEIPLDNLELLNYYSQFQDGKPLWSRKRRSSRSI